MAVGRTDDYEVRAGPGDPGVLHPRIVLRQSPLLHTDRCHPHHAHVFVSRERERERERERCRKMKIMLVNHFVKVRGLRKGKSCYKSTSMYRYVEKEREREKKPLQNEARGFGLALNIIYSKFVRNTQCHLLS